MSVEQALMAYLLAAGLLTVTPGVDTALVLRTSMVDGTKAAIGAGTGILVGLLTWGVIAAFGLAGLLAASAQAYACFKWVGAAYLAYLGIRLILKPRSSFTPDNASEAPGVATAWFGKGLATNLLNPKVGVFYVTFLPQFVPRGQQVAQWTVLLAAIHAGLGVLWFALLIGASTPLTRFFRKPNVARRLDRLTGALFIAFGAKLAMLRR